MWVVTTFDPQNNLLGVPAGSEGADSAGAIQSQGLQQPIQAAELAVDDLPANSTQRHELQHLCLFCLKSPSICFYFNSKIFFTRKIHSKTLLVHFVAPVQPLKRVGAKTLKQHYVTCFKNHSNVTVTYNRVNGVFVSALLWCIAPSDGLNLPLQNPTITKHSLHVKTSIAGTISVWKPWHERPSSSMQELLLCKQMQNTPSL